MTREEATELLERLAIDPKRDFRTLGEATHSSLWFFAEKAGFVLPRHGTGHLARDFHSHLVHQAERPEMARALACLPKLRQCFDLLNEASLKGAAAWEQACQAWDAAAAAAVEAIYLDTADRNDRHTIELCFGWRSNGLVMAGRMRHVEDFLESAIGRPLTDTDRTGVQK